MREGNFHGRNEATIIAINKKQINLKINESDLRLIDEKAKRYGLTRSSLIKLFAINGELSINIDRNRLKNYMQHLKT